MERFFLSLLIGIHRKLGNLLKKKGYNAAENALLSTLATDTSAEIITNAFRFDNLEVSDVMIHRVNVVGVRNDAKLDDIIYIALNKGFSRMPIYVENLDKIIGIIIVKDLLSLVGKTDLSNFSLSDFLRKAIFVPETQSCTKLFKEFKAKKVGMAIVVDEHGGTAGIVTMEDLVEKIMGNIQDEYDTEEERIRKIGDEKYEINGETDPEEILGLFGYQLPAHHEYETLAGFITDLLGFIPEQSSVEKGHKPHVDFKDIRFVAVGMEDNCISRVIAFRKLKSEKST